LVISTESDPKMVVVRITTTVVLVSATLCCLAVTPNVSFQQVSGLGGWIRVLLPLGGDGVMDVSFGTLYPFETEFDV
jgi:hypothetical protein